MGAEPQPPVGPPAAMPPAAPGAAQAPKVRPTWMVLLTVLALIGGALSLFSGLSTLKNPTAAASNQMLDTMARDAGAEDLAAEVRTVSEQILASHKGALRAMAIAECLVGLLYVYAAAMALSLDRTGRRTFVAAAVANIARAGLGFAMTVPFVRELSDATRLPGMKLARAIAQRKSGDAEAAATMADLMSKAAVPAAITALCVSIGFSLLLLIYFGGRKGRVLYGLESAPADGG